MLLFIRLRLVGFDTLAGLEDPSDDAIRFGRGYAGILGDCPRSCRGMSSFGGEMIPTGTDNILLIGSSFVAGIGSVLDTLAGDRASAASWGVGEGLIHSSIGDSAIVGCVFDLDSPSDDAMASCNYVEPWW